MDDPTINRMGDAWYWEERADALIAQLALTVTANQRRAIARALMTAYRDGRAYLGTRGEMLDKAVAAIEAHSKHAGLAEIVTRIDTYIAQQRDAGNVIETLSLPALGLLLNGEMP